jgi:hypothetical protein
MLLIMISIFWVGFGFVGRNQIMKFSVIDKCEQSIQCFIKSLKHNTYWFHSFVYGANKGVERKLLWASLASMKGRVAANPWMICGDFNIVKSLNEKWGSDKLNYYEVEFGNCLNDIEVLDLHFSGCFYTWTNKSEKPRFVARKLDRVLANEYWTSVFCWTIVEFNLVVFFIIFLPLSQ